MVGKFEFEGIFLISVVSGFVGGMSGMGGGVVLIPALTLLGIDIKAAIAVSMLSVIATSSSSASAYIRDHITNLKVGMFLEMFTIVGALVGASITLLSNTNFLFVLFGVVLLGSFLAGILTHGKSHTLPQDAFSRWLEFDSSYYDFAAGERIAYKPTRAYLGGPLMFGAGAVAGLLGIGAGALKVLVNELIMGLPSKVSTTTSNMIIGMTALAGTSVYLASGLIEIRLVVPVVLGISLGAWVATRLLVRLTNRAVHNFFLAILLVLGVEMIVRGVRG